MKHPVQLSLFVAQADENTFMSEGDGQADVLPYDHG